MSRIKRPKHAKRGRPDSVLFLCGRNEIRSPIAEMLARRFLPQSVFVTSAGVREGSRNGFVDSVLAELDLSLGDREPRTLSEVEDTYFDLIVTLSPEAHHCALELTRHMAVEVEYWPTLDPSVVEGSRDQVLEAYRRVRDGLAEQIIERFGEGVRQV
uniref:arsenate-mycothiol transferase ArsC n=1 Tax=Chelativorans sp. YIM 93263 TaxID=2906648 RepID=UPI00237980AA|nr:low molecular weight phosphatase family protein [Chelativorans sp. YIM 93263]